MPAAGKPIGTAKATRRARGLRPGPPSARAGGVQRRPGGEPVSASRARGRAGHCSSTCAARSEQAAGRRRWCWKSCRPRLGRTTSRRPTTRARWRTRRRSTGRAASRNTGFTIRKRVGATGRAAGRLPLASGRRLCRHRAGAGTPVVQGRPGLGLGFGGPGVPGSGSLRALAVAEAAHGEPGIRRSRSTIACFGAQGRQLDAKNQQIDEQGRQIDHLKIILARSQEPYGSLA